MKIRTIKKQVPKITRWKLYREYKAQMSFYDKPAKSYKAWFNDVFDIRIKEK